MNCFRKHAGKNGQRSRRGTVDRGTALVMGRRDWYGSVWGERSHPVATEPELARKMEATSLRTCLPLESSASQRRSPAPVIT